MYISLTTHLPSESEQENKGKIVTLSDLDTSDEGLDRSLFLLEETEHLLMQSEQLWALKNLKNLFLYRIRCFRGLILGKYPLSVEDWAQWVKILSADAPVAKVF